MKRLIIAAACVALSACSLGSAGTLPAPSDVADRTSIDETAGLTITVAYKAANRLALLAIRTGAVKGARAEQLKALDRDAFAWVERARRAYLAANAIDFAAAEREAKQLIAKLTNIAG